ncbi:hypothetical protein HS041_29300 [Planomonospora sp. ID67723]|uniref:hypothetical protein n=1 Tax=Planomonospora sp. ID67723 TaxID=2738134 RepID=UPI0018C3CAD0|nr:hypothetical protein [Planomonospora sp. ID67723]MBG0831817.1 hypothetical protein [Planomonospora sp. ID67723]
MRHLRTTMVAGALATGLFIPTAAYAVGSEPTPTPTSAEAVSDAQDPSPLSEVEGPLETDAGEVSAQARWSTIWYGNKNTKKLVSATRSDRTKILQIVVQCWNGGDGTRAKAYFQFKRAGIWLTAGGSSSGYCVGGKMYHRIRINNGRPGQFRAVVSLSPKSHTINMWVQKYA